MKLHLIEKHNSGKKYLNGIVVALTPLACYDLDNEGIEYKIPEDYYNREELNKKEEEYFTSQFKWINVIDEFLIVQSIEVRELGIKPARLYGYYLKNLVDPIVLNTRIIKNVIEDIKPTEVIHYAEEIEEKPLDWQLGLSEKSIFKRLLPLICNSKNVPYRFVAVGNSKKLWPPKVIEIKELVKELPFLQTIWHKYKFALEYNKYTRTKKTCKNFFIIKPSWGLDNLSIEAYKRGNEVFFYDKGDILKLAKFGNKVYIKNIRNTYIDRKGNKTNWKNIAKDIQKNSDIIDWLNHQCNLDVSPYFLPRFIYFITDVCPELINYGYIFKRFYEEENIDFVLTHSKSHLWEFAAMGIATQMENIKSIQITHGYSVFDNNTWKFTEMPCNIYQTIDKELQSYFENHLQIENNPAPKIVTTKSWLEERTTLIQERKRLLGKKRGGNKERIIFVPTMLMGNKGRYDSSVYPDVWYYKLQEKFIKFFTTLENYEFCYKGIPKSDANYNPILDLISKMDLTHITVSNKNLLKEYKRADKVIMDYPSTPMIESVAMGIPTLALYHKSLKVRETAKEKFGPILQQFTDCSDCEQQIEIFLRSKGSKYIIPVVEEDLSTLLEMLIQKH